MAGPIADLDRRVDYAPTSETLRLRVLARTNGTRQPEVKRLVAAMKLAEIEFRRRGS